VAELKSGLRKFPNSTLQARVDARPAQDECATTTQIVASAQQSQQT
jgi:hypothetical protein